MQRIVFMVVRSGHFTPTRRRGLCFSAFFLKIGSSGVVKFHQSKMSPFGLILLCSSILRTGFFAPKFVISKFYSVKGREAT